MLSADLIEAGGFSSIELATRNLFDTLSVGGTTEPVSTGVIAFLGDTTLRASSSLKLRAPRIVAEAGTSVTLESAYLFSATTMTMPVGN